MKLQWVKTSPWVKWLFPYFIWDRPNQDNMIFLTFDDGPVPEVTPFVLDALKEHSVRATFFCIGDNIRKHPALFKRLIDEGHAIGNHSFHHLKGWKTDLETYRTDTALCDEVMLKTANFRTSLFRPPYGKITGRQRKSILAQGKKIILWDILTRDYDKAVSPEDCLKNATEKVVSGSIILFHDSVKSFANMGFALPRAIEILQQKGFKFGVLD